MDLQLVEHRAGVGLRQGRRGGRCLPAEAVLGLLPQGVPRGRIGFGFLHGDTFLPVPGGH